MRRQFVSISRKRPFGFGVESQGELPVRPAVGARRLPVETGILDQRLPGVNQSRRAGQIDFAFDEKSDPFNGQSVDPFML